MPHHELRGLAADGGPRSRSRRAVYRSRFVVAALLAGAIGAPTIAQELARPRPATPALELARAPILAAARDAIARKDEAGARRALLDALWFDPNDAQVLDLAIASGVLDPDTTALFAMRRAASSADSKGGFAPDPAAAKANPAWFTSLAALEAARAAAKDELVAAGKEFGRANKDVAAPLVARFLRETYLAVAGPSHAHDDAARAVFDEACALRPDAHVPFVTALTRLMKDAWANRKLDVALLAARSLHGLAVQAGLKDLKGPKPPNLGKSRQEAADILEKIRALYAAENTPLSVEDLELMIEDDRIAYTHAHSSLHNPGVALSPSGMYRVETICGHGTLLGAASTIEYHHKRLANWYGVDPFVGKPGIARIVPEAADLEIEGAPYWWVGGFQSGDVTVLRFNASDIAALGSGLTHELTHRFDGAIYGGLPGWLAEGRAVWTGGSYGEIEEEQFVPNVASYGTIEETMRKGYGDAKKLEELIEGTIEDYRDNYVAGYALWVYLSSWEEPEGKRVFEPRLEEYMKVAGRSTKKPLAVFTAAFCDGKDGRPKDFAAFVQGFATFISGFYWLDRKPFTERYRPGVERKARPLIHDAPTWQFSRHRAEPWFGQEQAAQAGELLAKHGFPNEAIAALVYGQLVDEFRADRASLLANLLEAQRPSLAATILRARIASREPDRFPRLVAKSIAAKLPKTKAYGDTLVRLATDLDAKAPRAAAALRGDAIVIADALAIERPKSTPLPIESASPPFSDLEHDVGLLGYLEDELTDYEEHRVPNLWFTTDEGDVHVGRAKPRDATGTLDRNAGLHHAFTRGREWIAPGRSRIRGRVTFTTTFVSGAIVFGYTRRDRNLRLSFTAGDYMFSIGQKAESAKMDSVNLSLSASRDGEGAFRERVPERRVQFDSATDGFDFEILIDGSLAVAFVDGKAIGSYATADGQPIEGYVGFAASFGAYKVSKPSLAIDARLDALGIHDPRTLGLTLTKDGPRATSQLLQRKVHGIDPGKHGAVVLWFQPPDPEEYPNEQVDPAYAASEIATGVRTMSTTLWKFDFDPPIVAVVPRIVGEPGSPQRKFLEDEFAKEPRVNATIAVHDKDGPIVLDGDSAISEGVQLLFFVDETGAARLVQPFYSFDAAAPSESLSRWLTLQKSRIPPKSESGG